MTGKPEFFWSPPDGAPIIGVTTFEGNVVVATGSGVYVIVNGRWVPEEYTIHKISEAVHNGRSLDPADPNNESRN